MLSADTLYERGLSLCNSGRYSESRKTLERARQRQPGLDLAARISGTLGYVLAELGELELGHSLVAEARSLSGLSDQTIAVLTSQLGLISMRRGEYENALRRLSRAIDLLGEDYRHRGRALLNRGLIYLEQGRYGLSTADFSSAASAFSLSNEPVEQAKALHNQGYSALLQGDVVAALELMDQARIELAKLSAVALATCDADRAAALMAAGRLEEAAVLLESVVRTYSARRLHQYQGEAELILAQCLADIDSARAIVVAQRAARRFCARGNEVWALKADAIVIGLRAEHTRATEKLIQSASVVSNQLWQHRMLTEARTTKLRQCQLQLRRGELDAARLTLSQIRWDRRMSINARMLRQRVRAEIAIADNQPDRALRQLRAGIDELNEWQSAFGSIDLQSSTTLHGRDLLTTGIRLAVAGGRSAEIFEWSERTRNLASRLVPLQKPSDPVLADQLAQLRQLRAVGTGGGVFSQIVELEQAIRERSWLTGAGHQAAPLCNLSQAQEALAEDTVLLTYVWDGLRCTALVITDGSVTVHDLGAMESVRDSLSGLLADLDTAAFDLPAALAKSVQASLSQRLLVLDNALLRPMHTQLRDRRVLITAPGLLAGVPWTKLPSLAGTPVSLPASATRWVQQQQAGQRAVEIAGFVAGPGPIRAEGEVRASAALWPQAQVLHGRFATASAVAGLSEKVDVLHIAGHGKHSAEHPLFSGIELADGTWFGYDIDRLGSVPQVVVLSACEAGRSVVRWGNEALGMALAWLHAGARCVVAAPASVNDHVAADLLPQFHRQLAKGAAPAEALAVASGSPAAGFLCYGVGW